ncbi:hypothetical protein PGAG_00041 [Phaeocystis globosa virus 12T]|uniref:Uncharacterized protein n=1 Tax=Phaeocystis globosa virus PgV-16T TaxID=3071227 RepID=A0AC59EWU1_9VIRU|nr:hypothetical protein PGCG_00081 [Phaeocystis globosa virus]AET72931.1 hypothetical protein PGAG_00041 [Phaeocystis globosa virus 12T]AET73749.1 hypothetical protein PGBG_00041 [Phaeocystis globosa virus 14T]AGM15393.1 hypothetical protein PGCG_00081 [Phaeocystis globosa virus PgV-16T]UYE94123.1 hypothetical protein PGV14T_00081 [Phaeocystis globosa virus]
MLDLIRMVNATALKLEHTEEKLRQAKEMNDELRTKLINQEMEHAECANEIIEMQDKLRLLEGKNQKLQEIIDSK